MGWQIQGGVRTVQETMEGALQVILGHPVRVIASGRTDSGVHAFAQVINFPTESTIPTDGLIRGLNTILPGDVAFLSAEDVPPEFNATTDGQDQDICLCHGDIAHQEPFPGAVRLAREGAARLLLPCRKPPAIFSESMILHPSRGQDLL